MPTTLTLRPVSEHSLFPRCDSIEACTRAEGHRQAHLEGSEQLGGQVVEEADGV